MVSYRMGTQQKTVSWPFTIHPSWCAGGCWVTVAVSKSPNEFCNTQSPLELGPSTSIVHSYSTLAFSWSKITIENQTYTYHDSIVNAWGLCWNFGKIKDKLTPNTWSLLPYKMLCSTFFLLYTYLILSMLWESRKVDPSLCLDWLL